MIASEPIRIDVDVTNPGQFFACCGLLELADRLWPGAEGWFEGRSFRIACDGDLSSLIAGVVEPELKQIDSEDDMSSPMSLMLSRRSLLLNWWRDVEAGGVEMKVWAGSMRNVRIARAMRDALRDESFRAHDLLDVGMIVYDLDDSEKKVEPFYFDARRGPNSHSRDVGYSPNDLQLTTTAFPAVEFFCLLGLQRCLPDRTGRARVYDYCTWMQPLSPELLPPVVAGKVRLPGAMRYRFENWYRTGQKKHKAFRSAIPVSEGG